MIEDREVNCIVFEPGVVPVLENVCIGCLRVHPKVTYDKRFVEEACEIQVIE